MKDLKENPDWYSITSDGKVWSKRYERFLKPYRKGLYRICFPSGDRISIAVSKLMKTNFPFNWIEQIEEGEEFVSLGKEYCDTPYTYFISNRGRIWSNNKYRFLKPTKMLEYYWLANIHHSKKSYQVHTLVGRHFLPEYREGLYILHKDETLPYPEINYVENLWAGTNSENQIDCVRKGRDAYRRQRVSECMKERWRKKK